MLVSFKIYTSIPIVVAVLVDLAESQRGWALSDRRKILVRLAFWVPSSALSCLLYNNLDFVTALVGVNSMLISIIFPIIFWHILHKDVMSPRERWTNLVVGAASVLIFVLITVIDVKSFIQEVKNGDHAKKAVADECLSAANMKKHHHLHA